MDEQNVLSFPLLKSPDDWTNLLSGQTVYTTKLLRQPFYTAHKNSAYNFERICENKNPCVLLVREAMARYPR